MTLAEAVAEIEKSVTVSDVIGFPASDPPNRRNWSRAPNGEPYVTIDCGGIKPHGDETAFCATEEAAVEAWSRAVRGYLPSVPSILYWRERPQIEKRRGKHRLPFAIYSRLQCSPVKPDMSEEAR